jgi:hypothetical protein
MTAISEFLSPRHSIPFNPSPDEELKKGMTLIVMGDVDDIARAKKVFQRIISMIHIEMPHGIGTHLTAVRSYSLIRPEVCEKNFKP